MFTLEPIIKIIQDRLIWTPNTYLRGSTVYIDSIVLISLGIVIGSSLATGGRVSRAVKFLQISCLSWDNLGMYISLGMVSVPSFFLMRDND
jgi:hypothetical protein